MQTLKEYGRLKTIRFPSGDGPTDVLGRSQRRLSANGKTDKVNGGKAYHLVRLGTRAGDQSDDIDRRRSAVRLRRRTS
jgi:hypothetical protein